MWDIASDDESLAMLRASRHPAKARRPAEPHEEFMNGPDAVNIDLGIYGWVRLNVKGKPSSFCRFFILDILGIFLSIFFNRAPRKPYKLISA